MVFDYDDSDVFLKELTTECGSDLLNTPSKTKYVMNMYAHSPQLISDQRTPLTLIEQPEIETINGVPQLFEFENSNFLDTERLLLTISTNQHNFVHEDLLVEHTYHNVETVESRDIFKRISDDGLITDPRYDIEVTSSQFDANQTNEGKYDSKISNT